MFSFSFFILVSRVLFIFNKEYIALYEMSKIKIDKNIAYILSIIGFIAGIVLCYLSFYMPPKGIIDNSVLMFCGQMLSFTAAALGFSMHFETKFEKMSMEIKDSKQQKTE